MNVTIVPAAESAVRLLAFDLDGTLVDSAPGIVATVNQVLLEFGVAAAPPSTITAWIGLPLDTFWQRLTPFDPARWPALTDRYRAIYRDSAIPQSKLFPGVRETILALRDAGYILTIASSKITPVSGAVLEAVDLRAPFELLMGNDSVDIPKPHAEMLLRTLDRFGLPASAALMIGDTTHDIDLGRNAGVQTVAVANGTHDHATLRAAAPLAVIENLGELPAVLEQFRLAAVVE